MFATVINDCRDANALVRQSIRLQAALGCGVSFAGVADDLEAAGNLVDALDAAGGAEGFILVNVAPRNGKAKRWPNGTPFCHFRVGATTVLSSVDGRTLALAKKVGALGEARLMDLPRVLAWAEGKGFLAKDEAARIERTQFRSYEFLPRVAGWLHVGEQPPAEALDPAIIEDPGHAVWWTDNFGNCKTTILASEAGEGPVRVKDALVMRASRLKDVADGEAAAVIGSSGIGHDRFLEIVVQAGSAAATLGIGPGTPVGV